MKIVVATDFSDNAANALDFAVSLAGEKDGEIILVHAIEAVYDFASQAAIALDSMHRDAEALMAASIAKYQDAGVEFTSIIKEGTASIIVSKIAHELEVRFIVTGTQGSSGILKTLLGSTTINLIKESPVPVLVVPRESSASQVDRIVLALEFANREEQFIDWVVEMSKRWGRRLEFLHVQTHRDFEEEPGIKKLEKLLLQNYADTPMKIHTFYAPSAVEGLDQFLEENEKVILVMCHEHKNLWKQILSSSQTIEMLFHSKVPILVMP